jgi:hypothetical protein
MKTKPRPSAQLYRNYNGILGIVVGLSDKREKSGAILYEVKCSDCGEIHLRNAKHLKQGVKYQQCSQYKPPNYIGIEKRDAVIRKQYGITLEEYNNMLEAQDYKCAICGNEDEVEGRRLAIDHCHSTGDVRGLLCGKCNRGLGLFYDNQELLNKAIQYLKQSLAR